jgi:hypothetical protein
MSPAKPADLQILNSTRERTDCISLLATLAVPDEVLLLLRLVSLPKLESVADSRVRSSLAGQIGLPWSSGIALHMLRALHQVLLWKQGCTCLR